MLKNIRFAVFMLFIVFVVIAFIWRTLTWFIIKERKQEEIVKVIDNEYFESPAISYLFYHNSYPQGHQGGFEIIHHDNRVVTNGGLHADPRPDDWTRFPELIEKKTIDDPRSMIAALKYGNNGISYNVVLEPLEEGVRLTINLDEPLPVDLAGKVFFRMEILPSAFFGKTYFLDEESGIFPRQAQGSMRKDESGNWQSIPMGSGSRLTIAPEDPYRRIEIKQTKGEFQLINGQNKSMSGWIYLKSTIPPGKSEKAVELIINPNQVPNWKRSPVILHSQVGYHPDQEKNALIELPQKEKTIKDAILAQITAQGELKTVFSTRPTSSGNFLRYKYVSFNFSEIKDPGMYIIKYADQVSDPFKISKEVYRADVWQPTLDVFFPVQMDHLRINDRTRVWHGASHLDDAVQAPTNHLHFDGYRMGNKTWTNYKPFEHIPGLNKGGWYDAGDYDIRTISQVNSVFWLALAYEEFFADWDETSVDYKTRIVEIRRADGKPDMLQQIEHGVHYLLGCYDNIGHSIPGIIVPTGRQYSHQGDGMTMTDNLIYNPRLDSGETNGFESGIRDDRWAFTQKSSALDYANIRGLAAAYRVLTGYNDDMADQCLKTAIDIWNYEQIHEPVTFDGGVTYSHTLEWERINAAVELLFTTRDSRYINFLNQNREYIFNNMDKTAMAVSRVLRFLDEDFNMEFNKGIVDYSSETNMKLEKTPFGVPWDPAIWGEGWKIQQYGIEQYFLHKANPEYFDRENVFRVVNYVLGCHPGSSTSFVSGVGARSLIQAYGINRAEFSYIPGGVASGTNLIRPDYPEMKEDWPFLWQQSEYVMGGAASYIFCVLATDHLLSKQY
ncbi:glycoside hydrolase family 9 protein [Bacteroidota bacterium]